MNKKPDEGRLMDFLYGELAGEEREAVASYLKQHPEEQARLDALLFTRKALAGLPDKEVIAPSFIFDEASTQRPFWKETYFRTTLGIAASFLIVMISARLIGLEIRSSGNEIRIGFGELKPKQELPQGITEKQVNDMIQTSLNQNNEVLQASWQENRKELEQSIHKNLKASSGKIDNLMKVASTANQEQVRQFVAQLQTENLKVMKDYMQLSSTGQKEYLENLLVDFSKYLQEQRKQDLQFFTSRMSSLEKNSDQFKQETEQILTSLISGTSPTSQRRN